MLLYIRKLILASQVHIAYFIAAYILQSQIKSFNLNIHTAVILARQPGNIHNKHQAVPLNSHAKVVYIYMYISITHYSTVDYTNRLHYTVVDKKMIK